MNKHFWKEIWKENQLLSESYHCLEAIEKFVDYAFSSIIDIYNLRFVSRFFRAMIEERENGIVTKVVRRNFVHALKQFLCFVSVPGAEDIILDNLFKRFLAR